MNSIDAIMMALTPGSIFNQNGKVFRSAKSLAQFANVPQDEVLGLIAENLADRVTIRPSAKHPANGPLIALTEFVPALEENPQIQILGGNAVAKANIAQDQILIDKVTALTKELNEELDEGDELIEDEEDF